LASQEWFYYHENKINIANSDLEILNMIKAGILPKDVLVCNTKTQWEPASRVFLKEMLAPEAASINTTRNTVFCKSKFPKVAKKFPSGAGNFLPVPAPHQGIPHPVARAIE